MGLNGFCTSNSELQFLWATTYKNFVVEFLFFCFCSGSCLESDDRVHRFSCVPFLSTTEVVNSIRRHLTREEQHLPLMKLDARSGKADFPVRPEFGRVRKPALLFLSCLNPLAADGCAEQKQHFKISADGILTPRQLCTIIYVLCVC